MWVQFCIQLLSNTYRQQQHNILFFNHYMCHTIQYSLCLPHLWTCRPGRSAWRPRAAGGRRRRSGRHRTGTGWRSPPSAATPWRTWSFSDRIWWCVLCNEIISTQKGLSIIIEDKTICDKSNFVEKKFQSLQHLFKIEIFRSNKWRSVVRNWRIWKEESL